MTTPSFATAAAQVFRDYATDGVPASGAHLPVKSQVRAWGLTVETSLNALFAFGPGLINGKIVATVNASALTVAIKTLAGNDPSASDPVYVIFRGAGDTDGDYDVITLTAATSFVVSGGSTLGSVNATAFRLWLVGFNDSGTFRLALINCVSGNVIYPLQESALASSTAEGGAGAADSAGVFYTGTAVASRAFRIMGFLTWNSGLAAAGTWSAGPDVIQLFGPGIKKPGESVQSIRNADSATATGTTTTPLDDSPPLDTEGTQFQTQAITPKSPANLLRVQSNLFFGSSAAVHCIAALFRDPSGAGALSVVAKAARAAATNVTLSMSLFYQVLAASVAATTFAVRIGPESAGTIRFNGVSAARLFGGVGFSDLTIEELMG